MSCLLLSCMGILKQLSWVKDWFKDRNEVFEDIIADLDNASHWLDPDPPRRSSIHLSGRAGSPNYVTFLPTYLVPLPSNRLLATCSLCKYRENEW